MVEKEAETERKRAIINAEKEREVESIRNQALISKKEADKRIAAIEGMSSNNLSIDQSIDQATWGEKTAVLLDNFSSFLFIF